MGSAVVNFPVRVFFVLCRTIGRYGGKGYGLYEANGIIF